MTGKDTPRNQADAVQTLRAAPMTVTCPLCKAPRGRDCATSSGGFSVIHIARIKAVERV